MFGRLLTFLFALVCSGVLWLRAETGGESDSFEPGDTVVSLREVSVSAFKQQSELWAQPMASTFIDRREVERYNMVTMKDVSELTPNLYMPAYGSRMTSSIYMRGLGARIDQPVMGLTVDNVPVMNKDNYDFDLADIERIEVLRGPQSTLYGRNTMGGVINISTLSPIRYNGVRLSAEYGRGNSLRASASVYHRLAPQAGMSLSAYYTASDGFFRNEYTGNKTDKERQGSLRWKTAWRPSERLSADNVLALTVSRQGGFPYASLATGTIAHNDTCFYRRTGFSDGLSLVWSAGKVSVASSSSVQYLDDNMTLDQDFLTDDYFTLTQKRREWIFTEDVIVKGRSKAYSWLAGVFAFYRHSRMSAPVTFKSDGIDRLILSRRNQYNPEYPAVWQDESFVLDSHFRLPAHGVALYHNSSLTVGQVEMSAGIRVDYEKVSLDYENHASTGYDTYKRLPDGSLEFHSPHPLEVGGRGALRRTFTQLLPKLALSWKLPNMERSKIYVSVSKGYKAGGFNTQMFSDVLQQDLMSKMGMSAPYDVDEVVAYRPEKSWNYEAGAHIELCNGALSVDATAFFIDCQDQQLTMFPSGSTTGRIMTNAGRTSSRGAELSVAVSPVENLNVNASWGYTHATFKRFNNGKADYAGNRVPYAPENTLFLGASYKVNLHSNVPASVTFNVNLRGVGDIYWDEANTVRQPFYMLLGSSVELRRANCTLQIWGENIANRHYDTFYFVSIGNAFVQRGMPWRVGATLRVNFSV